jgi:two-component system, cell cycle sensor histidine kinase and response regulator CckA
MMRVRIAANAGIRTDADAVARRTSRAWLYTSRQDMARKSSRRVEDQPRKNRAADEPLLQSQQLLANELEIAQRLQHVATELIVTRGAQVLYDQIVDTARAILHADFASIQKFHPDHPTGGTLQLLGHRGFDSNPAASWEWIQTTRHTSCAEALRTGQRLAVPDVRKCDFMAGTDDLREYLRAGVLATHSTPLISRSGTLLGMVSAHWREPHEISASESRAMDVLARLAADLIDRSLAEEKLSESEQRLKNAERIARTGHWQWDIQTNLVSGSEEMYRIFGKPPDYIPSYGGFLQDLVPADRVEMERLVGDSLARKVGQSVVFQVGLPNGDLKTISCNWELRLDEEGEPIRMFGTCQDITDSRRAQEDSYARQHLESIGTLAGGIAHDFNNVLGAVLVLAELALVRCEEGGYPLEELSNIRDAASSGSEIVRQLMVYARGETDVVALVDVSQVVKDTVGLLNVSVSKRAVLKTDLGQDLPPILANHAKVRQIVMNLVTNASDALRDRDGVIRVTTKHVKAGNRPPTDGLASIDHLELEVSDTGPGMPPEIQAKVFDPFFTTKSAGRGLGLSVVQGIVRDLGGTILLTSEPDKGTTFRVLFPLAKTAKVATGEALAIDERTSTFHGVTLLIVEDERFLREAIARMLRKTGFEVLEAADGPSAIEHLRANVRKIDVILLDMTIPGASSEEIVVEATRARPNVPVILTSAYSQEMVTMSAPQVRDFIRKPFGLEDLTKTLRRTLSR